MRMILAVDCSMGACSTALASLLDGPGSGQPGAPRPRDADRISVEAAISVPMARGHAEALMPQIEAMMRQAGCGWNTIQALAGVVGPGSFTGVRIALAAVTGLALAAGCHTVGVSSLAALAADPRLSEPEPSGAMPASPILAAIDSRRGDAYLQWFSADGRALTEPAIAGPDTLSLPPMVDTAREVRIVGDADPWLDNRLAALGPVPLRTSVTAIDPAVIAGLAARCLTGDDDPLPLRPIYLRPPEARPMAGATSVAAKAGP